MHRPRKHSDGKETDSHSACRHYNTLSGICFRKIPMIQGCVCDYESQQRE